VESIHQHPHFSYSRESVRNNIALLKLTEKVSSSGNYVTLIFDLFLITTFTLDAVKPICIVINPKAPRTLSVLLNVNQEGFMGVHKENVVPVDNSLCSQKIGMIVGTNQFCVENRGALNIRNLVQ